jgi:hypothetical protein
VAEVEAKEATSSMYFYHFLVAQMIGSLWNSLFRFVRIQGWSLVREERLRLFAAYQSLVVRLTPLTFDIDEHSCEELWLNAPLSEQRLKSMMERTG